MSRRIAGRPTDLLVPIAVGVLLRALLILASPDQGMAGGDLAVYHATANRLSQDAGAWVGGSEEFGWRAPVFFIYLASAYLPFGGQAPYWFGQVVTALLFVPMVLLLVAIGTRLEFPAAANRLLAWLPSVLPNFVVVDVWVMSEPLLVVLLLAFLLIGIDVSKGTASTGKLLLFGAAGTLMMLTREVGMLFFGAGVLALLPSLWREGPGRAARAVLTIAVAALLLAAPWAARNRVTNGQALPLSYTSGYNLHVGNHPGADGRWSPPLAPGHVAPDSLVWATPRWSDWHGRRAKAFILEDPVRFAGLVPDRLAYLLFPRAARQEILELQVFPRLPRLAQVALVILAGISSALLILAVPLALGILPGGYYRNAAICCSVLLIAAVSATHGIARFLDSVMHLILPGTSLLLADPRAALLRAKGALLWVTLLIWAGVSTLWAMMILQKS